VCTLVLAWQVFADEPVVVAANRDESLSRPSEPPARRDWDAAVVAPRDSEAGGTWVGYNEHALFVGITNRWGEGLAAERSRGLLVRDVLGHEDAESAVRAVERAVEADEYDGFNLVVADERAAFLLEWDGGLTVRRFDPGVHVVVNVGVAAGGGAVPFDSFFVPGEREAGARRQAENARGVRDALTPDPGESADSWVERARATLGDHRFGVCIHGDDADPAAPPSGFGTRSSSLVRLGESRRYEFADGPPCRTAFHRVESQV
jgi:hypothetical protein